MTAPDAGGAGRLSVSVVIPVLDDAEHLRTCLAHLAAQRRAADEVVVVDNGCTDDSVAVARAFGARVVREPRRGIPAASAAGFDAARGDLLLRCDADTRAPSDWVERIVGRFTREPALDALTGPGDFYDQPRGLGRLRSTAYDAAYRWAGGAAIAGTPVWGSNLALRADVWRRVRAGVHRHRPDLHDDLDLSFQLALAGALVRFDPRLRVGAAGRIFRGERLRQGRMALATMAVNWAVLPPGRRWMRRLGGRRGPRPRPSSPAG